MLQINGHLSVETKATCRPGQGSIGDENIADTWTAGNKVYVKKIVSNDKTKILTEQELETDM